MVAWGGGAQFFRSRQLPTFNELFAPYGGGLRMRNGRKAHKIQSPRAEVDQTNIAMLSYNPITRYKSSI